MMKHILFLVLSVHLVLSHPAPAVLTSTGSYPHSIELSVDYKVFWKHDDTHITFEIHAKTEGWVGFGVSPDGDLPGSDLFIGSADDDEGKGYDYHATSGSAVVKDAQQDWTVERAEEKGDYSIFVVTRKLVNCDPNPGNDLAIEGGVTRVVFALGSSDSFEDDDDDDDEAAAWESRSMVLLNPEPAAPNLPNDVVVLDFKFDNAPLSSHHSPFLCELIPFPELTTKHNMIRFEPLIQPGHEYLVHHMIIDACPGEIPPQYVNLGHSCFEEEWPVDLYAQACTHNVIPWAANGGPFTYPDNAGFPFEAGEVKYVRLEILYNNSQESSDIFDSSGLRMYLTPTLRQHDAGTLSVGHRIDDNNVPSHDDNFLIRGHCWDDCLDLAMGSIQELNMFAALSHTHALATTAKVRHVRNGVELPPIVEENHYDPLFQPYRKLSQEVKVQKGDNLIAECTYDTSHLTTGILGGNDVPTEMCIIFFVYYPKVELLECWTAPTPKQALSWAGNGMYNSDGDYILTDGPYAGKDWDNVMTVVDWSDESKRNAYQQAVLGDEHMTICNKWWWRTHPITRAIIQVPSITTPFVKPNQCPAK